MAYTALTHSSKWGFSKMPAGGRELLESGLAGQVLAARTIPPPHQGAGQMPGSSSPGQWALPWGQGWARPGQDRPSACWPWHDQAQSGCSGGSPAPEPQRKAAPGNQRQPVAFTQP